MHDIAVMGILPVLGRLPLILRRIRETAQAIIAAKPDVLVIIDSPDFTHRVAKKAKQALPSLKVINYSPPTVWAWRQGRAKAMRAYVDQALTLLPFEPEAMERLGGPPSAYVGHPAIERLSMLTPAPGERAPVKSADPLKLLVLPGSRRSEIRRLMPIFGETLRLVRDQGAKPFEVILPAVPHLVGEICALSESWPVRPHIITGEDQKHAAFRQAHAALAASGTVTLELMLAGVPMVVGYKVSKLEEQLKHFIKVPTIVLANLVLGRNAIPEFVQWDCTPDKMASALGKLLEDSPERTLQVEASRDLIRRMTVNDTSPSQMVAAAIMSLQG